MLFNSIAFAIFLPIVFALYWFFSRGNTKAQNVILLVSSYFFYSCWDYRFLFLLIFSTLLDYVTGRKIYEAKSLKKKRIWLFTSLIINLGFLGVFKYYNFFAISFTEALSLLGIKADFVTINVILPVGISFYTFHGISYVIDLYYNKIKPENNFINYSVFVCFFPLLVAGPIERATHLLPQIVSKRQFEFAKAVDGMRQILWGLFKKIVIADNCATYVNEIFQNYQDHSGITLIFGAIFFAFQIYCDFSGYSDIAIGTARLFGIELLRNFAFPYFSRDIAEFWRRWHISLTTWFRDYLYIPLGGSKTSRLKLIRNTIIVFVVSGFWHGANFTFIAWGGLNALLFIPLIATGKNRHYLNTVAENSNFPSVKEFFQILLTFSFILIGWVFFRAPNITVAIGYLSGIASFQFLPLYEHIKIIHLFLLCALLIIEWCNRHKQHGLEISKLPIVLRWGIYFCIVLTIYVYAGSKHDFIYFQF